MADILIRSYLPASLGLVKRMAPVIISAGQRYGVDPVSIAAAIALEQNNAEQFWMRYPILDAYTGYTFRGGLIGDGFMNSQVNSAHYYGSDIGDASIVQKALNPITLDVGPARFRVALGVETVEAASESDPVLANYKGHPAQHAQDMTLDRGELTA